MQLFTYGRIHVTPRHVTTDVTLEKLLQGTHARVYSGRPPSRGFAALRWSEEDEAAPRVDRSNPGKPSLITIDDRRVLIARLFIDREDRRLFRVVGGEFENLPAERRYELDAIDVMVIEDTSLLVFIATKDADDVAIVLNRLRAASEEEDDWQASAELPHIAPTSDLLLWLLYRQEKRGGQLAPGLEIVDYRSLSCESKTGRLTRSLRGVALDRGDILCAVADGQEVGPAKVAFYDKSIGLVADLFWLMDGTFDVHRNGTEYDEVEGMDAVGRAELGLRSTLDVTTRLLPGVHRAYQADTAWRETERKAFRSDCATRVACRYGSSG